MLYQLSYDQLVRIFIVVNRWTLCLGMHPNRKTSIARGEDLNLCMFLLANELDLEKKKKRTLTMPLCHI